MRKIKTLEEVVFALGGQARVSRLCGVTQPAIHRWLKRGLPSSEWVGSTEYAIRMSEGLRAQGRAVSAKRIRELGHPMKIKVSSSV